jgi:hypothetical protein
VKLTKGTLPVIVVDGKPLAHDDNLTAVITAISAVPGPFAENDEHTLYEAGLLGLAKARDVLPALAAYAAETRAPEEPTETVIRDLLSSLMHLIDLLGPDADGDRVDFDYLAGRAFAAYRRERDGNL